MNRNAIESFGRFAPAQLESIRLNTPGCGAEPRALRARSARSLLSLPNGD